MAPQFGHLSSWHGRPLICGMRSPHLGQKHVPPEPISYLRFTAIDQTSKSGSNPSPLTSVTNPGVCAAVSVRPSRLLVRTFHKVTSTAADPLTLSHLQDSYQIFPSESLSRKLLVDSGLPNKIAPAVQSNSCKTAFRVRPWLHHATMRYRRPGDKGRVGALSDKRRKGARLSLSGGNWWRVDLGVLTCRISKLESPKESCQRN